MLSGPVANFLWFLTWDPSVIWNTGFGAAPVKDCSLLVALDLKVTKWQVRSVGFVSSVGDIIFALYFSGIWSDWPIKP